MNRVLLVLIVGALATSSASAQFLPEIPKLPGTALPAPKPLPPTAMATLTNVPQQMLLPLPGSIEDQYGVELEAREALTKNTPEGNVFRFLPSTLLWEPPLAVKRDPRLQVLGTNLSDDRNSYKLDTSLGGTLGLFRYDFVGRDASLQLDIFGVAHTRFSPGDLVASDYRAGLPLTWKRGWWSGKIAYEHTSGYLGRSDVQALVIGSRQYQKDEIVLGLSRILYDQLRLYGHAAYAFGYQAPDRESSSGNRSRADLGFEWFDRKPTGFAGTPFVAGNADWRGDQDGQTNLTIQAGWLWRNPYQRFGTARVFIEHYRGQSPFGQLQATRETFTSIGFGFDY